MQTLRFPWSDVIKQLEHTESAPCQSPFFEHLYDPAFWKPGVKPGEGGYVSSADVDPSKLKPALAWVKDRGSYVMSMGTPPMLAEEGNAQRVVVYADGFGPDADYDELRATCGGDDFAEQLSAADIREMARKHGKEPKHLCVRMLADFERFEIWVE